MRGKEMINYLSTRDTAASPTEYSFEDAVLTGLAPDGGLLLPDVRTIPQFGTGDLPSLKDIAHLASDYPTLYALIVTQFARPSFSKDELQNLAESAFSDQNFPDTNGNPVPVEEVIKNVFVQNLSLGPTAAFKDMALQPLGRMMEELLARRDRKLTILGATSGDTGSAAEAALKGLANVNLFMLSPKDGMSPFQRAQMGMLSGGNIINISVNGDFDACQDLVKEIVGMDEFKDIGAVNSINWGRIVSQIPYYVSGYFQAVGENIGEVVDFIVPSGNFGNALAGFYAKQMGLPIGNIVVATNENDVLNTFFETGKYKRPPGRAQITTSPSMDITKASNLERLLYYLFAQDSTRSTQFLQQFSSTGQVDIQDFGRTTEDLRAIGFASSRATSQQSSETIKTVYDITDGTIILDPHTAVGMHAALAGPRDRKAIVLETALPVKFEATIQDALGMVPQRPPRFANLEQHSPDDAFMSIEPVAEELAKIIRRFRS